MAEPVELTVLDALPEGLEKRTAAELHEYLPGPSLIHLPGRRPEPVFVSALLHGNEDTGWEALKRILNKYETTGLPRALSLFIGNVAAAAKGQRRLDGQPDYNRIWGEGDSPEHAMTRKVLEEMAGREVFAAIDIHNNTGRNPHYGCINRLATPFFHMATLFGRTVVYFTKPDSVLSMAFADLCPSVTVECGQPGEEAGIAHAMEFIDASLHLSEMPEHPVASGDIHLFHTMAIIKIPEAVNFSFGEAAGADIHFDPDLDRLNFTELPKGTVLGHVNRDRTPLLEAWNEQGLDVCNHYFEVVDDEIRLKRPVMPSMLTLDERVIRQDCLCYFMERLEFTG
ncbi:MAG: succinylglutamate desuccinylase/aspartoacylase family protein [Gammaproteobacteria bacterium]|nr:succinylglutamate desuccinylase/aspartoacylase family protein [Gammaproteobacteria bacterium]